MTTTTNKDKPGKTPSSEGRQDLNNPNNRKNYTPLTVEERKKVRDYRLAMAKKSGFKHVPFKGVIIQIPEGPLF